MAMTMADTTIVTVADITTIMEAATTTVMECGTAVYSLNQSRPMWTLGGFITIVTSEIMDTDDTTRITGTGTT